jgi:hypothetical protein
MPGSNRDAPDPETLALVYEDLVHERDRLRDARRQVTARLGPLPAAAGIVLGLFAGLPEHIQNRGLIWGALGVFLVMIAVSSFAIGLSPYRRLIKQLDAPPGKGPHEDDALPKAEWLRQRIQREREVYYGPARRREDNMRRLGLWAKPATLEASFNRERWMLLAVQWLLALEVLLLLLARLLP